MTNEITFKDLNILHVCNPKLKNSYISICKKGFIKLKTPRVSDRFIQNLLSKKELWIRKQLLHVSQNKPLQINLEDEVLLFGEVYSIDAQEAKELRCYLEKLKKPDEKNVIKCYDNFYKLYASQYIVPKVEQFSKLMNLDYEEIKFKKMRSRWGSCSSKRVITLNTQLIKIDKELIDYIIVHELAHLTHMNHSRKFHDLVDMYISNAKDLNKRLKAIHLL
ncbi:M48 family metallopeptidase [Candidatus Sulfurimonas baltica]|uniref:M48 family metallopeptidase n=1 Tax=Candidatus Sulfurimonas baltica TaxID=2740404 RepID=A0A7S7LY10_9BACT|nr:M48 family metallopeptidase [Candidatus Sulfurimonas baltica]